MAARFTTVNHVVDGLGDLEARFRASGDRRAIFLTLYGVVSAEMRERLARGEFLDNAWVSRYLVAFAELYRVALEAYDAGRMDEVPKSWRLCFDAAARGNGLVLQDMLLGVNAHVNNDLPLALTAASIEPDREARYRDHAAVNAVLASVTERATARIAALYAPGVAMLDGCAGHLDEMLSMFSLAIARESAWEGSVALANARSAFERRLAATVIGSRAAVLARLLLAPTTVPAFTQACRRVEQSVDLAALVASVKDDLARH